MRLETPSITVCLVLMILAVSVSARPKSLRRIARMQRKINEKTSMAFAKRSAASEELIQRDEDTGRVLAKLLGFDAVGTDERRLKPNPYSAEVLDSSNAPRLGEPEPLRLDESTNETSQGKRRVRRRCPAGQWPCELPTSLSQISFIAADRKQKGTGQAKRRVRRYCSPGQWPCPTGSSS